MKIIDDLSSKVLEIVTSKDFNPKTKGTVRFIINQCLSEVRTCIDAGLPLKELVRILNEKSQGYYVFRYDSFFKAWKKTNPAMNKSKNIVLNESALKSNNTKIDKIENDDYFSITGNDELGNVFTNDPNAPFGRDKFCYPYHEIKKDAFDTILKKGISEIDVKRMLKYGIDFTDLFGLSLPLKNQIAPKIDDKIDSIRKNFTSKNIGLTKTKFKDIIK
ncbi:TPA: hypothetical protein PXI89_002952 [Yersinia enterocolitica]|nr:hypothetical protein [Yersinia enterocolitica]